MDRKRATAVVEKITGTETADIGTKFVTSVINEDTCKLCAEIQSEQGTQAVARDQQTRRGSPIPVSGHRDSS